MRHLLKILTIVMLLPLSAVIANAAEPLAEDSAALARFGAAGEHAELGEYMAALSGERRLALAPLIAKHSNPDMRYLATMVYVRHGMTDEATAVVTDFLASSDLGEKHMMALGWAMIHGSEHADTLKVILDGVMKRVRGDLDGFTPEQQARLRKLLGSQ